MFGLLVESLPHSIAAYGVVKIIEKAGIENTEK